MLALMGASVSGVDNVQLFPLCFPEPRPALGEAKGKRTYNFYIIAILQ